MPGNLRKAKRLYEVWHDYGHSNIVNVDIPIPNGILESLGEIIRLDYTSPKWEHRDIYYYHNFEKNSPMLLKDRKGNLFIDGFIKVTELGIDDWDDPQAFEYPRNPPKSVAKLGILELIMYIDPESKKVKTLTFGDRYYVADPEADWTYITSPMKLPISNPTLRQEIHNALRKHKLPLDALNKESPQHSKALNVLKVNGLLGRFQEVGTTRVGHNKNNGAVDKVGHNKKKLGTTKNPFSPIMSIISPEAIGIVGGLAAGIAGGLIGKVIQDEIGKAKNPAIMSNPIYRCSRPIDEPYLEDLPLEHDFFIVDGQKVGYGLSKKHGSFIGPDEPIREKAKSKMDCHKVNLDKECFLDIIKRGDQFEFEAKDPLDIVLYESCQRWSDRVEDLCRKNPIEISPPWALDEWITPNEDTALTAIRLAKEIGAFDAYYESTGNGTYRVHLKWRIFENPKGKLTENEKKFGRYLGFVRDCLIVGGCFTNKEGLICCDTSRGRVFFDEEKGRVVTNPAGGLAYGLTLKDIARKHQVPIKFLKEQLKMGIIVEYEHTSDPTISKKIALDHLFEMPNYYTLLARMEENPTLQIPVHSKEQRDHLFEAQKHLGEAGVTFDTGYDLMNDIRDWELDWSLKGATLSGQSGMPLSQMTLIDKFEEDEKKYKSGTTRHIWEIFFDGNDEFRIFRDGEHKWRSSDYHVKQADKRWEILTKRKHKVSDWHKKEEARLKKLRKKNPYIKDSI